METSKNLTVLVFIFLLGLSSCTTSDDLNLSADNLPERTDIEIKGDFQLENFAISDQDDQSVDLVSFNYYGNPSENFDYIIQLGNGNTLTIEVYDAQHLNPWQQVDLPYNIYPGQTLEDKLYYTNILLTTSGGGCSYSTNFDNNIPPGIFIDVFKVIKNDGREIQCRIRDMILYKTNSPNKSITINGTFVGALNFD